MTAVQDSPRPALVCVPTPLGRYLVIAARGDEIAGSEFVHRRPRSAGSTEALRGASAVVLREARRQVEAYFSRRLERFSLPLAFCGTPFECGVWRQVAALAFGEFVSYADVARAVGRPLSHRGVARAMGRSQFALFVPAHRVVGADGKPRGLTPRGTRARLIAFEKQVANWTR
ncbi:MAG: methylated-DNA--[protein]-cysteine S-methyltransferase [Candidatus Tyrphobacter sp.]